MNCNRNSRAVRRWLAVITVSLLLASAASAEWKEKVLYSFQGGTDGATPAGGVVFDRAGNLYGATQNGGSSACPSIYECGTVYQLAPPAAKGGAWTETVLYVFKGNKFGDGASPGGGLVADPAGNLYGTTEYGGTGDCVLLGSKLGCGAVFELSPPKQKGGPWTETVLYSFPTAKQGYVPWGDLVFDRAGNLYGATQFGGGYGTTCNGFYQYCGAVFELSPPKSKGGKWTEKVLHGFKSGADGAAPNGGLVLDSKGALYGATAGGGGTGCQGPGCGTAFELKPPTKTGGAWTEKMIHTFTDGNDGVGPNGGLIFDANGALYGTAGGGGDQRLGVIFRLARIKHGGHWSETVLHNFTVDKGGRNPWGPLTFDTTGNLYGTAHAAASDKFGGIVFAMKPATGGKWSFAELYNFAGAPDAAYPVSKLIFHGSKNVYSTTQGGGAGQGCQGGCGAVFELSP